MIFHRTLAIRPPFSSLSVCFSWVFCHQYQHFLRIPCLWPATIMSQISKAHMYEARCTPGTLCLTVFYAPTMGLLLKTHSHVHLSRYETGDYAALSWHTICGMEWLAFVGEDAGARTGDLGSGLHLQVELEADLVVFWATAISISFPLLDMDA